MKKMNGFMLLLSFMVFFAGCGEGPKMSFREKVAMEIGEVLKRNKAALKFEVLDNNKARVLIVPVLEKVEAEEEPPLVETISPGAIVP